MFTFPFSRRQADRRPRTRRPLVENLEGRQLLSGLVGQHIGTNVVAVVPRKQVVEVGPLAIQGNHIGTPAIVGSHIGMNVATAIQGNHIGTPAIIAIL